MPPPVVTADPVLVSVIVEQVLVALQRMTITNVASEEIPSDTDNNDGNEGLVVLSLPPAPVPLPAEPTVYEVDPAAVTASIAAEAAPAINPSLTSESAPNVTKFPIATHASTDTWYMISAGHAVGIFRGWHIVRPLVIGVSGACFKKYPSEAAAIAAFSEARTAGVVIVIPQN